MSKKLSAFPWDYYVDEPGKTVYVCIPGGYPTTLALPRLIARYFPDYKGSLCTSNFLAKLKENNQ